MSWRRTIAAVPTVNPASAALAVPVMMVTFTIIGPFEQMLNLNLNRGFTVYDGIITVAGAFIATTLVNALFEGWILVRFWKVPRNLNPYWLWLIANGASNGIVFVSFFALMFFGRS